MVWPPLDRAMLAPAHRILRLFLNPLPHSPHPRPVKRRLLLAVERAPLRLLKRGPPSPRYHLPLLPVGLW